jgi:hypothetical protein
VLQTARYFKTEVQRETKKMKDSIAEKTKERWHGKRMHGQLPRSLDEKLLDIEQSYRWLKHYYYYYYYYLRRHSSRTTTLA